MRTVHQALEEAIRAVTSLRTSLAKGNRQVRSNEERSLVRATAQSWFHSLKPTVADSGLGLDGLDDKFAALLEFAEQNTTRQRYVGILEALKNDLVTLRTVVLRAPLASPEPSRSTEAPPDFTSLASDERMKAILVNRWMEITACVEAEAPLSATVMMGGLLEGLLLARVLRLGDQERAAVFKTAACPRGRDGKALPLNEWTLKDYLPVAHELGWIGNSAKDVGVVVRDYRNFVHPQKQYSHSITISARDARLLWAVCTTVAKEIIESVEATRRSPATASR
jgi:hypothetical protein